MLILCSNGLTSNRLIEAVSPFICNDGMAALVVTADYEYKDKNYHVPRCTNELRALGLSVELFDLDVSAAKQLLSYDVVEFIGGNPFYLLDSIRRHNAADTLREAARKNVLIGWSAAAFVFGPSLELVNQYSPEMNFMGLADLTAASLTTICVLPHYDRFLHQFDQFEEKCQKFEAEHGCQVIRMNDGDGVLIQDNQTTIVHA